MDIFSRIEGQSGENYGSALLSYLIFNSPEIREAFIALLSDNAPDGPISFTSHFACRTEYPTTGHLGDGRLDILIQLDDVVIGIENKFFAEFQENQPIKYLSTLKTVAVALKEINRAEVRSLLFVLCPESRKKEALEKIRGQHGVAVVTWEETLKCMKDVSSKISDPVAKMVAVEFIKYLGRRFSFVHEFERKAIHLRRTFPDYGTPLQGELVSKLWPLFPSAGGRLSNGKTWAGYYFYTDPEIKQKGWFGFVRKDELEGQGFSEAELIIATTYQPELEVTFRPVCMRSKTFIDAPGQTNAWRIEFDASWNNIEIWRKKLAPLWSAVSGKVAA